MSGWMKIDSPNKISSPIATGWFGWLTLWRDKVHDRANNNCKLKKWYVDHAIFHYSQGISWLRNLSFATSKAYLLSGNISSRYLDGVMYFTMYFSIVVFHSIPFNSVDYFYHFPVDTNLNTVHTGCSWSKGLHGSV